MGMGFAARVRTMFGHPETTRDPTTGSGTRRPATGLHEIVFWSVVLSLRACGVGYLAGLRDCPAMRIHLMRYAVLTPRFNWGSRPAG